MEVETKAQAVTGTETETEATRTRGSVRVARLQASTSHQKSPDIETIDAKVKKIVIYDCCAISSFELLLLFKFMFVHI